MQEYLVSVSQINRLKKVKEALELKAKGASVRKIASALGVSVGTACLYTKRPLNKEECEVLNRCETNSGVEELLTEGRGLKSQVALKVSEETAIKRRGINPQLRLQVLKRDRYRCIYCGVSGSDAELQIDHIHPVSLGGTNHMSNLATACAACNLQKSNKLLRKVFVPKIESGPYRSGHFILDRIRSFFTRLITLS